MGIADGGEVNSLTTREPVVDIFLDYWELNYGDGRKGDHISMLLLTH